jgi:O-antigen/teichoic acid export membrane protein
MNPSAAGAPDVTTELSLPPTAADQNEVAGRNETLSNYPRLTRLPARMLGDSLSRMGLLLLVNTAITGVLGLIYWFVAARLFPARAVGVAGALVASMSLLSGIGQLNLSGTLMRFLPNAGSGARCLTRRVYAVGTLGAGVLALIAIIATRLASTPRSTLYLPVWQAIFFVIAAAAWSIFNLQDSALIALKRTGWVIWENAGYGIVKILLLFVAAASPSAFGIFGSWAAPLIPIVIIMNLLIFRALPRHSSTKYERVAGLRRYVVGDAGAGLLQQAWIYLLPVLITVRLGSTSNAQFYVCFLITSTVDLVGSNFASALTVHGSDEGQNLAPALRRTATRVGIAAAVLVGAVLLLSGPLLALFGSVYARAVPTLRIMTIACLPRLVIVLYLALSRLELRTHRAAVVQFFVAAGALLPVAVLGTRIGLMGVALGLLVSCTAIALVLCPFLLRAGTSASNSSRMETYA